MNTNRELDMRLGGFRLIVRLFFEYTNHHCGGSPNGARNWCSCDWFRAIIRLRTSVPTSGSPFAELRLRSRFYGAAGDNTRRFFLKSYAVLQVIFWHSCSTYVLAFEEQSSLKSGLALPPYPRCLSGWKTRLLLRVMLAAPCGRPERSG